MNRVFSYPVDQGLCFSCSVFMANSSSRQVLHLNIRTYDYVVSFFGGSTSIFWRDLISVSSLMLRSSFSLKPLSDSLGLFSRLSSSISTIDYVREGRREKMCEGYILSRFSMSFWKVLGTLSILRASSASPSILRVTSSSSISSRLLKSSTSCSCFLISSIWSLSFSTPTSSALKRAGQRGKNKRGQGQGGGEEVVPLGLVDLVFCGDLILKLTMQLIVLGSEGTLMLLCVRTPGLLALYWGCRR